MREAAPLGQTPTIRVPATRFGVIKRARPSDCRVELSRGWCRLRGSCLRRLLRLWQAEVHRQLRLDTTRLRLNRYRFRNGKNGHLILPKRWTLPPCCVNRMRASCSAASCVCIPAPFLPATARPRLQSRCCRLTARGQGRMRLGNTRRRDNRQRGCGRFRPNRLYRRVPHKLANHRLRRFVQRQWHRCGRNLPANGHRRFPRDRYWRLRG